MKTEYKPYFEKLKDPRWQRKRLEIMERDRFACRHCKSTEDTLNVHHRVYKKGKQPWECEDHLLITLCEDCHQEAEDARFQVASKMGANHIRDKDMVMMANVLAASHEEFTFLGWSAECIAAAARCHQEMIDLPPSVRSPDVMEEFKTSISECVRHLHEALFLVEDKYPES